MKAIRPRIRGLLEKYLPLSGTVGGLAGGVAFLDSAFYTRNGWSLLLGLFSLFYAVFYYRWVTAGSGKTCFTDLEGL